MMAKISGDPSGRLTNAIAVIPEKTVCPSMQVTSKPLPSGSRAGLTGQEPGNVTINACRPSGKWHPASTDTPPIEVR